MAHGNSYSSIWPAFNVGKYTVMEAVQNFVKGLYELRNEPKFSDTLSEVNLSIATFADLINLPKVVGAIDGSHVRNKGN